MALLLRSAPVLGVQQLRMGRQQPTLMNSLLATRVSFRHGAPLGRVLSEEE